MGRADQNQRPEQLADVIVGIVAEHGVDAISVREVASRAGVSIGTVQHYFPTKDQMLAFAVDRTGDAIVARMQQITAGCTIGDGVRTMLLELLPLDAQRRDETTIWMSFLARAVFTPDLLSRAQQIGRGIEEQLTATIERAQQCGEATTDLDATRAARMLYALAEGLTSRALTDPERIGPAEVTALFDDYLVEVFPAIRRRKESAEGG